MAGAGLEAHDVSSGSELERSLFLYVYMRSSRPAGQYRESRGIKSRDIALSTGWYRAWVDPGFAPKFVEAPWIKSLERAPKGNQCLGVCVCFAPKTKLPGKLLSDSRGCLERIFGISLLSGST